jgi:predicted PolB exonuclease-like 3'-5' exonuclease
MITCFDIETITPRWKPPEDKPDMFPPVPWHKPIVLGWLRYDAGKFQLDARSTSNKDDERDWSIALFRAFANSQRIVSFNGRGFDMIVLQFRAMALGLPQWSFYNNINHRFPNYKKELVHYDMMEQLSEYGATRGISLDASCKAIGLPGKIDVDGAAVSKLYEDGQWKQLEQYCAEDVFQTWMLYLSFSRVREQWGADRRIDQIAKQSKDFALTQPLLKRFCEAMGW